MLIILRTAHSLARDSVHTRENNPSWAFEKSTSFVGNNLMEAHTKSIAFVTQNAENGNFCKNFSE